MQYFHKLLGLKCTIYIPPLACCKPAINPYGAAVKWVASVKTWSYDHNISDLTFN